MRVLMQFMLLFQMLIDLMTGYSWQGGCCCREDVSKGQSKRELAKEKKNEEAELEKRKSKLGSSSTGSNKRQMDYWVK